MQYKNQSKFANNVALLANGQGSRAITQLPQFLLGKIN